MMYSRKVVVPVHQYRIVQDNEQGDTTGKEATGQQLTKDTTFQDVEQIPDESIGTPMFHPIVVPKHIATINPTPFSVRLGRYVHIARRVGRLNGGE